MAQGLPTGLTFSDWTASGGTITTACPTGFDCSTVATGAGFLQTSMTDQADPSTAYIQTIVTDAGANRAGGDPLANMAFYDVTYVRMAMNLGGGATTPTDPPSGIAGQQGISETTGTTEFTSDTSIRTGWALQAGQDSITINQNLVDTAAAQTAEIGDDFRTSFVYAAELDDTGARTGFTMDIEQLAGLQQGNGQPTDVQAFTLRERAGSKLQATGSPQFPDGGTISYAAGDDVKAVWVGQNVDLSGGTGGGGMMGSLFGYQSYENVTTDPGNPVTYFSLSNEGPFGTWDTTFGAAPCMSDPSGASCP